MPSIGSGLGWENGNKVVSGLVDSQMRYAVLAECDRVAEVRIDLVSIGVGRVCDRVDRQVLGRGKSSHGRLWAGGANGVATRWRRVHCVVQQTMTDRDAAHS